MPNGPYEPGTPYPRAALAFLAILGAGAATALYCSFSSRPWRPDQLLPVLVWCAVAAAVESSAIYLPRGNIHVSSTEAVIMASYLSVGLPGAMTAALCATLLHVSQGKKGKRRILSTHPRLTLFNAAHYAVILFALHCAYRSLGGPDHWTITDRPPLVPAMAISPSFFALSCLLNALFYKLEEGRPFWRYLIDNLGIHMPTAMMVSLAAVLVAVAYSMAGIPAIALFALPLMLTRLSILAPPEEWQ